MNMEVILVENERRNSIRHQSIQYERRQSIKTTLIKTTVKKCCFCIDLRTGCMAIAIITIIVGLCILIRVPFTWYMILAAITGTLSGILLLYGTTRNSITSMNSYLVMEIIGIIAYMLATAFIFIETQTLSNAYNERGLSKKAEETRVAGDLLGILFVFMVLLKIYFWICGFRFSKELKSSQLLPRGFQW